jgi:pyruvate dehydrogenase E2 component (dihydrolipoamide acetyltransferase)
MAFQLVLPDIGEGVVEAEILKWLVAPGDVVEEDQPIVEVMTDKATVVIPSPRRGRVARLCWSVGELAKVHAPLVELDGEGERPASERKASGLGPQASEKQAPGLRPQAPGQRKALATPAVRAMAREMGLDVDDIEGTGPGGRVTKDDLAAAKGRRNGHARIPTAASATPTASSTPTATPTATPTSTSTSTPTPNAEAAAPPEARGLRPEASPPRPEASSPDAASERLPLRGLRRRMAEHMARAKRTAAHFTFVEQCDATELVRVKDRIAAAAHDEGVKVTFLPFVLKAAVAALRKHPHLNATMDEERAELIVHRRYDLGVAASTGEGLAVPVVRGVDRRSILDLARELERLGAAARAGRIAPEDLGRSTFTVTSLGALGGLFATPVLNHPEVAILGIHRIRPTPVARDGQVVVRDVMHVSVTCDHRVVEGHAAAAFAYDVIRLLEAPELLFAQLA